MTNLKDMKVKELREMAKELNITGRWDMTKEALIEAIEAIEENQNEEMEIVVEETEDTNYEEFKNSLTSKTLLLAASTEPLLIAAPQEVLLLAAPKSKRGRTRKIEVYKDGQLLTTVDGLIQTFIWAEDNHICNQGWVRHSLKTGEETKPGRKFKDGGYRFSYAN